MTLRTARVAVALGSAFVATLSLIIAANSLSWVGTTFPGFFLLANRVVPSIALPSWEDGNPSRLFQSQVIAVNGHSITSALEAYEQVRRDPPGTRVEYTLRTPSGQTISAVVTSRQFTVRDYALTLGALLANGVVFAAIGLIVLFLKPGRPATLGLLSACGAAGIFAITAADLYGPHWFFRLHVLGETFMVAGFIHLALVFPTDRLRRHRRPVLLAVYLPYVALAVFYECVLQKPALYTIAHLATTASHGLAVAVIVVCLTSDFLATSSALIRRRVGVVALGTIAGVAVPGALMAASALLGGRMAINAGVLTAFFFPLSLSYAIVKQNLFEIDVMLRRAITYVTVVVALTVAYLLALLVIGFVVPTRELFAHSPATLAVLNLALLLLLAPTRARVQDGVDRIFFRKRYDAEHALSELSQLLASARAINEVTTDALAIAMETLCVSHAGILLHGDDERFQPVGAQEAGATEVVLPIDLAARVVSGEVVARYEWEDGSGRPIPPIWQCLNAEILVPIRSGNALIGLLVMSGKGSGRAYTMHDVVFLRTLANQTALAMINAGAFSKLEELNASLERQVYERTAALEGTNRELSRSIAELRHAYELLERNQASLLRADRLATLGRLAAGLAHEINTPLGAVLNSLKLVVDLGREYADSIEAPEVLPDDHRAIAAEIISTAEAATTWTRKATAFLSRTKLHGRELRPAVFERFAVGAVVDETCALLAHRLRASTCSIDYHEDPVGVAVCGDQTRLGQVLVNLVSNAVDAYEDNGVVNGRVEISARRTAANVVVIVRDWAGGIPEEVLPHIFEELFTTKEPGRGTGLGLWIARNLVEDSFAGKLSAESVAGVGTCFTATLPLRDSAAAPAQSAVEQHPVLLKTGTD